MAKFFAIVQLLLKLLGAWEAFMDWMNDKYSAELDERAKLRREALEDAKKAETDDDIWESQDKIVDNLPTP